MEEAMRQQGGIDEEHSECQVESRIVPGANKLRNVAVGNLEFDDVAGEPTTFDLKRVGSRDKRGFGFVSTRESTNRVTIDQHPTRLRKQSKEHGPSCEGHAYEGWSRSTLGCNCLSVGRSAGANLRREAGVGAFRGP